jgi:hypothetical protein
MREATRMRELEIIAVNEIKMTKRNGVGGRVVEGFKDSF